MCQVMLTWYRSCCLDGIIESSSRVVASLVAVAIVIDTLVILAVVAMGEVLTVIVVVVE